MDDLERLTEELKGKDFPAACEQVVRHLRSLPHYDWVGIYLLKGDELVLFVWDGPQATEHTRIPLGKGVCGLAARERRTVIVDDVNEEPRYLACFPSTRSEIVVPIITPEGRVLGEIDIDSDRPSAFGGDDQAFLEKIAELLASKHPD